MRYRHLPTLLLGCLLIGCHAADQASDDRNIHNVQNVDAPAGINLEPEALEKLSSWDETSKASAELTTRLAEIMSEIKDKESAATAIPKLRAVAHQFAAVNRAKKTLGEPSKEDRTLVLKNLAESHKKFDAAFTPLVENEELHAIVGQAIDDAYVGTINE